MTKRNGVSIIVCTYNGGRRLKPTLEHLAAQEVERAIPWEVIIVDNASTDNTADVARSIWSASRASFPLRLISETKPGLNHARLAGLEHAQFDIVSMVDDDNWVAKNWVQTVYEIMNSHPEVAACGGSSMEEFEGSKPTWFDEFRGYFVVGEQTQERGILNKKEFLSGAGLSVRKTAWLEIMKAGFAFLCTDRKGASLSSGGDIEICYALVMNGWKLYYEPTLQFKHFIPAARCNWNYVRRLSRSFGEGSVLWEAYVIAHREFDKFSEQPYRFHWLWRLGGTICQLTKNWRAIFPFVFGLQEGNKGVLAVESCFGRIHNFIHLRADYTRNIRMIANAPWLKSNQTCK